MPPRIHMLKPAGPWGGHEGGAFINEMDALIKETPKSTLSPPQKAYEPGIGLLPNSQSAEALDLPAAGTEK